MNCKLELDILLLKAVQFKQKQSPGLLNMILLSFLSGSMVTTLSSISTPFQMTIVDNLINSFDVLS